MSSSTHPASNGPRLRIDTQDADHASFDINIRLNTPSTEQSSETYPSIPVLRMPTSPKAEDATSSHKFTTSSLNSRAPSESRKLLAHLLGQLVHRQLPRPVFDSFKDVDSGLNEKGLADVAQAVRAAVKLKGANRLDSRQTSRDDASDEEDGAEKGFVTDTTFELMNQLKDVLLISRMQNWQIFHDETTSSEGTENRHTSLGRSPFRRRTSGLHVSSGRQSRSPSPARGGRVQAPELLSQCINVLASVVMEDCRFKISSPRPSRPPNALQTVVLDVAQFLLHSQRHDVKVVSQIGFALIPAFSTFPVEMQPRLLAFFEDGIIRGVLDDLRKAQGDNSAIIALAKEKARHTDNSQTAMVSIRVEEPADDGDDMSQLPVPWIPWSPLGPSSKTVDTLSTRAPRQPLSMYYLTSLTSPLLVAILDNIDLTSPHAPTLHRLCQLVNLISTCKPDAYLDVLEVVAYHTSKARRSALCLLSTLWPSALGHAIVSKPLPIFSYLDSLQRIGGVGPMLRRQADHPYTHQFVPWRFPATSSTPALFEGVSQHSCRSCSTTIHGFGLLCPFCLCGVHFDCYDCPEGSFLSQYSLASDPDTQKVAVYRFSHVLSPRRDWDPWVVKKGYHVFRLVNIFTLSLCFICRTPLWGCVTQGLKCSSCQQFMHTSCLQRATFADLPRCRTAKVDSQHMTITSNSLRRSFSDHYRDILAVDDLKKRTYEEISVIFSVLWIQLQLLNNGVALGSVVIDSQKPSLNIPVKKDPDDWELHYVLQSCERYLASGRLPIAVVTDEYIQESRRSAAEHCMMFDWSHLGYIATIIKSPFEESEPIFASHNLLNVNPPQGPADGINEAPRQPFEVASLPHMRNALGYEMHIFSDAITGHLLSHLHHLGFFHRQDLQPIFYEGRFSNEEIPCVFAIPLGLDVSTEVETLFAAIEGCLSDLDLSVNEQGLLLLTRKLWPNGMASEYGLHRLTQNLISWILAEDFNLAAIFRDYLAQGRELPGVRTGHEPLAWPSTNAARTASASAPNNGGDYVASRRALLNQYVARWLLALHDEDVNVYAKMVYGICADLVDDTLVDNTHLLGAKDIAAEKKKEVSCIDSVLRRIIKLYQNNVTFAAFDDIFLMWLETVSSMGLYHEPIPSLYRLFNRDTDNANRVTSIVDASVGSSNAVGMAVPDAWRLVMKIASADKEGWCRSLQWLCLFARSGVDIPVSTYLTFSSFAVKFGATLIECELLVEAALSSSWLKSMGHQHLQKMFSTLHSHLTPEVLVAIKDPQRLPDASSFIRKSLATCLILYGFERNALIALGMITETETKDLPSRRKMNTRVSQASDPIIIDLGLMDALDQYVQADNEDISCFIAKFLNTFVTDSSLLEPYEVDNFILRNGRVLSACAWHFYDIHRHELSGIRISFLLRILVVDAQPFQALLQAQFESSQTWENRFLAVIRLHRIILDVTNPSFHVEERQWRSSIIEVFYRYFSALWVDDKEEIRLVVDTWSQSLLPAHFEAISLCWNESLAKAPIAERVKLVSFLVQLHSHFPTWRVLSWDVILETLLEDDYVQKHGGNDEGAVAAHLSMYGLSSKDDESQAQADPDMTTLRVSLLLLSLQMIEDGISIDTFSLLKIKFHLTQAIGFKDVSVVPASNGHAFHVQPGNVENIPHSSIPCVNHLLMILDASHPYYLSPAAIGGPLVDDETPFPMLVGTIFVDITLYLFDQAADSSKLPVLTVKSLLESLMIIIHKHDIDIRPLKHLHTPLMKAVRRAMELVSQDISYEIRQLALSVVQAHVKKWPHLRNAFLFDAVENAAKLIVTLDHNSEDVLVAQARSFLGTSLTVFSTNGIFGILFKRPLDHDFFTVVKYITDTNIKSVSFDNLRDELLQEAISSVADSDYKVCQITLNNISTYVEVVHHQGYSAELMQSVGIALTNVARRSSDWPIAFDPSPMFLIFSMLLQHNKSQSRDLLAYVETTLRVALTRFNVSTQSMSRLLHVSSTLFRKVQNRPAPSGPTSGQVPQNTITLAVFEILGNGLRKEGRVTPLTIAALVEAITAPDSPGYITPAQLFPDSFLSLADDGFYFLQNHLWSEVQSENDFNASVAVAKMILQAAEQNPDIMLRRVSDSSEKPPRHSLSVRTWNILAFAALSGPSSQWSGILFTHFTTFAFAYNMSLRSFGDADVPPSETAQADINHAYNAIKLWLMLALKRFRLRGLLPAKERDPIILEDNEDAATRMVWNELWPAFSLLVDYFDPQVRAPDSSSLAALTWSSVAELFLFVRQSQSAVAHEASSHVALLVRLQAWSSGDSATSNRLGRVIRSMSEPPGDVPMDILTNQVAKSIVAEEKLVVLEAKSREASAGRTLPERNRRGAATAT